MKKSSRGVSKFSLEHLELCSEYFDADFYRSACGISTLADQAALEHYLTTGWLEGLDPSASFSTAGYLRLHTDVAQAEMNPLFHYAVHGVHEERQLFHPSQGYEMVLEQLTLQKVVGWVVNKEDIGQIFDVGIYIDGTFYGNIRNDVDRRDLRSLGKSAGKAGFSVNIPFDRLEPGSHLLELLLPNGNRVGHELAVGTGVGPQDRAIFIPRLKPNVNKVKVVVPIYNAVDDVRVCIERLQQFTPEGVEVILIDDCSPDPEIARLLGALEDSRFQVLANAENLGFTRTVNRGFDEAGDADVIILNSDARVTPKWVEGLYAAAYSREQVATVTAMSDRAGAFSAPDIGNENDLPPGIGEIAYAQAFRRRSLRLYPEVPTGNGFCMYIRRAALDELGALDSEAFPKGYGEENDFCMRALRAGWANLIDDATYVFHDRSKSFGASKDGHLAAGRKVVDERYPEYNLLTSTFRENSLIKMARFRARQALNDCSSGNGVLPRALFVLSTRTGGTPQTNADLMGALAESFECWVLNCDSSNIELSRYQNGEQSLLFSHSLAEQITPATHRSSEYDDIVVALLNKLDFEVVHIRHLAWHSLSLPRLAKQSGARVFYSLHDFYTLCPSLKLLDNQGQFCGGQCTKTDGDCKVELWSQGSMPQLKNQWVHTWRSRMAQAIEPCDGFITTSHSARERILRNMPSIPEERFHVIPHGRDFTRFEHLQHMPDADGPVRILVPGNIDQAKGLGLITALLELDALKNFEFHVLGGVHLGWLQGKKHPRLRLHDRYQRSDFADKVGKIAPHFGIVFSIWDETYCHTLTEMWSVGLPVAVLDFPTLNRRVNDSGAGWVLEGRDPESIYNQLVAIALDRQGLIAKGTAAIEWQMKRGAAQSCRQMASRYLDVYRGSDANDRVPKVAVVCPADRGLQTAYASTEIRVWERTRNRLDRPLDYIRTNANGLIAQMRMGMISAAIIQRTAIPAMLVDSFLSTAKETGTPYLFELDDQLLKVPEDKDNQGFYGAYKPYLEKLLGNAEALLVSTEALAAEMRPYNDNVVLMPNRISNRLWGGVNPPKKMALPNLLYMGTRTHDEDLNIVLGAIEKARLTYPGLKLKMIGVTGSTNLPEWVNYVEILHEHKSYSSFVPWLRQQVDDCVLGIAPLLDSDFNAFKSPLKILDYGALGLPVLASKVPVYEKLAGEGATAPGVRLVDNTEHAWAQQIVSSLGNVEALAQDGLALRDWVFSNHSLDSALAEFDATVLKYLNP